ncbi:MAG TPA: hypothetical protein VK206_22890 [Anaerolineales bacterium]|nr:hypothetical protein [Anaerolineales bacterium]
MTLRTRQISASLPLRKTLWANPPSKPYGEAVQVLPLVYLLLWSFSFLLPPIILVFTYNLLSNL